MFTAFFTGENAKHRGKRETANKPLKLIKRHPCPYCDRQVAEAIPRCPNCGNSVESAWLDTLVSLGKT